MRQHLQVPVVVETHARDEPQTGPHLTPYGERMAEEIVAGLRVLAKDPISHPGGEKACGAVVLAFHQRGPVEPLASLQMDDVVRVPPLQGLLYFRGDEVIGGAQYRSDVAHQLRVVAPSPERTNCCHGSPCLFLGQVRGRTKASGYESNERVTNSSSSSTSLKVGN